MGVGGGGRADNCVFCTVTKKIGNHGKRNSYGSINKKDASIQQSTIPKMHKRGIECNEIGGGKGCEREKLYSIQKRDKLIQQIKHQKLMWNAQVRD